MALTAEEFWHVIEAVYRRWLHGQISQEDALFEIGDLLSRAETGAPVPAHERCE